MGSTKMSRNVLTRFCAVVWCAVCMILRGSKRSALSVVQHALSLFRTQRIIKIFLEVDTQANKLVANIWAENGAALPLGPATPIQTLIWARP